MVKFGHLTKIIYVLNITFSIITIYFHIIILEVMQTLMVNNIHTNKSKLDATNQMK